MSTNPFEEAFPSTSTNPFDSPNSKRRRSAALNFQETTTRETPALRFGNHANSGNTSFVSPLEDAFRQEQMLEESSPQREADCDIFYDVNDNASQMDSSIESEQDASILAKETSPLLGHPNALGRHQPPSYVDTNHDDFEGNWIPIINSNTPSNKPIQRNASKSSLSIHTGLYSQEDSKRQSLRNNSKHRVLKALTARQQEDDGQHKLIRLEEVGTAKSWMILLLPYFAFVVCLLLESNTNLKIHKLGPLGSSHQLCWSASKTQVYDTVPIKPAPPDPCNYRFELSSQYEDNTNNLLSPLLAAEPSITQGAAFDSGILTSVPPAATFLSADASFFNLTLEALAAVEQGSILVSALLFQKTKRKHKGTNNEDGSHKWSVVATSRTEPLSMACYSEAEPQAQKAWVCHSPTIMEILFSMPGSAILSGEQLRITIVFSYTNATTLEEKESSATYLNADYHLQKLLRHTSLSAVKDPGSLAFDIVQSSEFTIQHTDPISLAIDVWGRVIALTATIAFAVFWFRSLGIQTRFRSLWGCSGCWDAEEDDLYEIRRTIHLLDSPWVLFPERWYIAVLLVSIILIQGPLVVVMYFTPQLNTNPMAKTASDTMVGLGVNAVLFVYLSLFQGFQYHTASAARKWVNHHRTLNEIRRVATYVGDKGEKAKEYDKNEAMLRYTRDHIEQHGDVDGTFSPSALRLYHDPFGPYWADFLIPKLFLFALGAVSIWLTAYTRFHFTSDDNTVISAKSLKCANAIYLGCYCVQFGVLMAWVVLIMRSSIITGEKLRLQPFLATRPAQLAYRVIFAHVTLGFLSLAVMLLVGFETLIQKWKGGENGLVPTIDNDPVTSLNFWLQLLARLMQRFPYSGTASSIGFGRIFFATVSVLIAAFIFLPPKHSEVFASTETEDEESEEAPCPENRVKQRRDKRAVVSMMRNAHTWRVFPLPIERATVFDQMLMNRSLFQLYHNGERDFKNLTDSAVVSTGPYTPVFCTELACWLLEASFQAYYSPKAVEWNDDTPGEMNIRSIGLQLEAAILDEETNTQAFVATNIADQVDAEEDQCIVVAFRGSVDATNAKTDLKYGMVQLLDQIIGVDRPPFRVSADGVRIEDSGGWIWNAPLPGANHVVNCFSASSVEDTQCMPFRAKRKKAVAPFAAVSKGAMAVLSATPVARNTLPCIHEGFSEVYSVLRRKVIESILPVLQRQLAKAIQRKEALGENAPLSLPKIYITGHSLGGSLAQLLALDLASNCELLIEGGNGNMDLKPEAEIFQLPTPTGTSRPSTTSRKSNTADRVFLQPPICVYTYGQPRVGNRAFSRLYKQRVPHTFRVATEGDPFTAMPHMMCCAGIYKHAGLEVVLDEGKTGNVLVGPTIVETLFRFRKVRTNLADHSTNRYRDCLESALEPHELQEYYRGHMGALGVEEGYGHTQSQNTQEVPEWMTHVR